MRQTIEIKSSEEKQGKSGKYVVYTTTSNEKLTCFEDNWNKDLARFGYNNPVEVELVTNGQWTNIKGVFGKPSGVTDEEVVKHIDSATSEPKYMIKIKKSTKDKHTWEVKVLGDSYIRTAERLAKAIHNAVETCKDLDAEMPQEEPKEQVVVA